MFFFEIGLQTAIDDLPDLSQSKFTQCNQIAWTKEMRQGSFSALYGVDVAPAHSGLQCFGCQVGKHNLVHPLHYQVWDRFTHHNSRDPLHERIHAFDVLHIHRRYNVDLGIEQLHDVFMSLHMLAAVNVRVRQFIDQSDRWVAVEDGIDVHFLEHRAFVAEVLPRNDFETRSELCNGGASVRFDDTDNDILTATVPPNALTEHVVGLADTRSITKEELESAPLLCRCGLFQPLLGCLRRHGHILTQYLILVELCTIFLVTRLLKREGWRFASSTLVVVIITYAYRKLLHVNPTTVGFTFLLAVLIVSASCGLRYAVFTALLSTFAYNYFFLPPVGHVTIADPQNWIALAAFLVTAVIASELSDRARREALNANHRRREVERLYSFSQQLLAIDNILELLNAIPRQIVQTFGATASGIFLSNRAKTYYSDLAAQGLVRHDDLQATAGRGEPASDEAAGTHFAPLRLGARSVGSVGVVGGFFSGEVLEAIGSLIAIAVERADAMEELSRTEAARQNEKLRTALLDSVTHEFRTPLTSILASAKALLSEHQLDEDGRQELLTVIDEEGERLNRLVGEAAEMAQLDAHQVELHLRPNHIRDAVDGVLEESARNLQGHPIELSIPDGLPDVRMDLKRIQEVLAHLLDNAAKYSPAGTTIHISAEVRSNSLVTSVADHGPGIDEFEQGMIFDKFYRGRGQRSLIHGTGMGLAIVKAIIEAHHGTIGVTSQLGHGSVFSFSLPLQ